MGQFEPILQEKKDKFVIFPVKHHDIWDWYKKVENNFWTAEEIDLHQDLNDWNNKLNANERFFIKHLLAFLPSSNAIVKQNLSGNFLKEIQYPEAHCFFAFQISMENIHSETYSLLFDTYTKEEKEKYQIFKETEVLPGVQKKASWVQKWQNSDSFAERLVAFAAVERISFAGAFCSVSWLKKRNLLPGFTFANELISRDKEVFSDFAVHLHNHHLINKISSAQIRKIVIDALEIEKEFITKSLPASLLGLNAIFLNQYLEFVADGLLLDLECEPEYGSKNPFDFIATTNSPEKSTILEKRVGELQKAGLMNKDNGVTKFRFNKEL